MRGWVRGWTEDLMKGYDPGDAQSWMGGEQGGRGQGRATRMMHGAAVFGCEAGCWHAPTFRSAFVPSAGSS